MAAGGSGGKRLAWARMKKAWTDSVALLAKAGKLKPVPRAWLRFRWHEKARNRDPDNVAAARKFILDGLVVAGVLRDDGWDEIVGFEDSWLVSDKPGVEVIIETE